MFIFVFGSVAIYLCIAVVVLIVYCASLFYKGLGPRDVIPVAAWVLVGIVISAVILSCGGLVAFWLFFGQ